MRTGQIGKLSITQELLTERTAMRTGQIGKMSYSGLLKLEMLVKNAMVAARDRERKVLREQIVAMCTAAGLEPYELVSDMGGWGRRKRRKKRQ